MCPVLVYYYSLQQLDPQIGHPLGFHFQTYYPFQPLFLALGIVSK